MFVLGSVADFNTEADSLASAEYTSLFTHVVLTPKKTNKWQQPET